MSEQIAKMFTLSYEGDFTAGGLVAILISLMAFNMHHPPKPQEYWRLDHLGIKIVCLEVLTINYSMKYLNPNKVLN